jgi:sugar lactone lactonase YvrE
VPADGAVATAAPLVDPRACAVDAAGRVYVLERGGHALRVVELDGTIRTVAGTGKKGWSGDGGPALQATLNGPKYVWLERDGNVLIADAENHVIRRYRPATGGLENVAGTGQPGAGGLGGEPLQAQLNRPHGVWEAADGALYIADSFNHRIVRITR